MMPPDVLSSLGLAAGVSLASGIRVYATIAVLGLLHRFHALQLPPALEVISHPAIIGIAALLYVAEFVADKVPAFDSAWDTVHTFIRVPAAGVLAFAVLNDVTEPWRTGAALLGGTIALSAHGLKAGTRLAANTSPEPVSNWLLSFGEEVAVAGLLWVAVTYPLLALAVAGVVLFTALLVTRWLVRSLSRLFARRAAVG